MISDDDVRRRLRSPVASAFYGRFKELRPAQAAAIEPLLAGRNVVIASGTGSGKTEAAAAPLLSRYLRTAFESDSVVVLYIAPTRALVNDLNKRLTLPVEAVGLRVGIRHGERDDLKTGRAPHVLVTTPESLDVMLIRGDAALDSVQAVVIDEVHLLNNTQRGLQLSVLIRRLQGRLGRTIQWAALSATVGELRDTVEFLFGPEEQADLLDYPSGRPIDAIVRHLGSVGDLAPFMRRAVEGGKTKVLLFADSRAECERLTGLMTDHRGVGAPVFAHYSSLSRDVREKTEAEFAACSGAVCVATSTLELGIDIGDIDLVALWGAPSSVESFLQRIGRGNRRSHTSNVACLIPDSCTWVLKEYLTFLALLDAARAGNLPQRSAYRLYGSFLQQSMSRICAEQGSYTRLVDLLEPIAPCGYCDRETLEVMMDELAAADYVSRHGFQRRYGAADGLWSLVDFRMIYGNFPASTATVEIQHASRVLGDVPAANLLRLRPGAVVRFAGRAWRVVSARADRVEVESAGQAPATAHVLYGGVRPGLDAFVADRIWEVLAANRCERETVPGRLSERIDFLTDSVALWSQAAHVPFVRKDGLLRYFTFAGRMVNRTVARALGQDPQASDDVVLTASVPLDFGCLSASPADYLDALDAVFEGTSDRSFFQGLLPTALQQEEFRQPWLRDATIPRILARLRASSGAESQEATLDLG